MNFDIDLSDSERAVILARRATLAARADGVTYTTAHLDELRKLALAAISLSIDDEQLTADDREYSRGMSGGVPNVPEYRHELLMEIDPAYYAAWAYDHTAGQRYDYTLEADAEPTKYALVELGRINHPYRESDPEIVDRSLLRNGFRDPRLGETQPPLVVGRYAPKYTIIMPSIVNESVVPEMTVTY